MKEDKQLFGVMKGPHGDKYAIRIKPTENNGLDMIEGESEAVISMHKVEKDGWIQEDECGYGEVSEVPVKKVGADERNAVKWKDDKPGTNILVNHKGE